ncbi:MAG: hypothetical protein H0U49_08740 [Parachlamydiaceae bacterium]|nr:hypothetical protein [Parachlamydiaceae bacterium]
MSFSIRCFILSALLPLFVQASNLDSRNENPITADIVLSQEGAPRDKQMKFQPVFPVKITSTISNHSSVSSKPTKLLVRYAYPQPYHNSTGSLIFETEAVDIPVLQPGEEKNVQFAKGHQLPTISDFVLNDWAMRQYQAITVTDGKEIVVGTLALTYSAYYYPIKARD